LTFSGDGQYLAVAGCDGVLRLWDTTNWQPLPDVIGHAGTIWGLAASPDGRYLASAGSDGLVRMWDLRTRDKPRELRGHTDAVWGVAFRPDGRRLASVGRDGTVCIWDLDLLRQRWDRGGEGSSGRRGPVPGAGVLPSDP
jgi:WD40 repeat protein